MVTHMLGSSPRGWQESRPQMISTCICCPPSPVLTHLWADKKQCGRLRSGRMDFLYCLLRSHWCVHLESLHASHWLKTISLRGLEEVPLEKTRVLKNKHGSKIGSNLLITKKSSVLRLWCGIAKLPNLNAKWNPKWSTSKPSLIVYASLNHTNTHSPAVLYLTPHPDTDWQVFAESLGKVRHETYGGPALLSCLPSHESFVDEVEVAGAVRSLSEQQEEANTVTLSSPIQAQAHRQSHPHTLSLSTPQGVCQLSLTSQTSSET